MKRPWFLIRKKQGFKIRKIELERYIKKREKNESTEIL